MGVILILSIPPLLAVVGLLYHEWRTRRRFREWQRLRGFR